MKKETTQTKSPSVRESRQLQKQKQDVYRKVILHKKKGFVEAREVLASKKFRTRSLSKMEFKGGECKAVDDINIVLETFQKL